MTDDEARATIQKAIARLQDALDYLGKDNHTAITMVECVQAYLYELHIKDNWEEE